MVDSLQNIQSHKELIQVLANSKPRYRKAILKAADKKLVMTICDIIYNLLQGNVKLSESETFKLRSNKKFLRKIIQKSSFKDKKRIIEQKGSGILGLVLPAVIATLSSIFSK
jgi:hypothetical protein